MEHPVCGNVSHPLSTHQQHYVATSRILSQHINNTMWQRLASSHNTSTTLCGNVSHPLSTHQQHYVATSHPLSTHQQHYVATSRILSQHINNTMWQRLASSLNTSTTLCGNVSHPLSTHQQHYVATSHPLSTHQQHYVATSRILSQHINNTMWQRLASSLNTSTTLCGNVSHPLSTHQQHYVATSLSPAFSIVVKLENITI